MNKKNQKNLYVFLYIAILMINALIIVAFRDRAAITLCSIPAIVFAFCSTVYASVAISLREQCNLFFYNLYFIAKLFNRSYTETEEYKKDFVRFAFVYCATIPIYITFSLFANNIYLGLIWPLTLAIIRDVVIILLGLVPPFVKNIVHSRQQKNKEEIERKEQERRESMGDWK